MAVNLMPSAKLDEFVAECERLGGLNHPNAAEYIGSFSVELSTEVDQNLDPFSEEYFRQQLKVYEELSGRTLDQETGEMTLLDVDHCAKAANPYASGDVHTMAKHAHTVLASIIASKLPANAHILDLGCGWGLSSEMAAFCGAKVHSIDINPLFVDLVNRRASSRSYDIVADTMQFDTFQSKHSYDMAFFYECLHHAVKPWETLANIAKYIKPDGKITFAGEPINTHWWKHWGLRLDAGSVYCIRKFGWFESGWSEDFIKQCFKRVGFDLELIPGIGLDNGIVGVGTRTGYVPAPGPHSPEMIRLQSKPTAVPPKGDKMRIVIDLQGAQGGSRHRGIGRYTLALALAMARYRGDNEIIIMLNGLLHETIQPIRAAFAGILPQENICVWDAVGPTSPLDHTNTARRHATELVREAFIESLNPDVVHITSIFEGYMDDAVHSMGRISNYPTAVTLYDLIPIVQSEYYLKPDPAYEAFYKERLRCLKKADLYLAISDSSREEAIEHLNATETQAVNISAAVDDIFRPITVSEREKKSLFKRLELSRPFIMYSGASDPHKNQLRLIKAYALLPSNLRKKYQLAVVGGIPNNHRDKLEACVKECGLGPVDVIITGWVNDADMITLYNECALFVFPSWHEGFGLPALEAMACGAPVIGSKVSSLPQIIGREDALFDPFDEKSIARKMAEVLNNKQFRDDLKRHGLKQAKNFSWEESAKRALEALQRFNPKRQATASPYVLDVLQNTGLKRASQISPLLTVEKTSIFKPQALKILAIKLDHLGDFLLAIPALTKLKARYPYASIDVVVGSWNVAFAEQLGIFNTIFTYDFFKQKSSESPAIHAQALETLLGKLSAYDIAIDLRRHPETRFLLIKSEARLKVGYETFDTEINNQLDIALTAYHDAPAQATPLSKTSISRQMLALVDALPQDINDYVTLPKLCEEITPEPGMIAIFPKAGTEAKEWAPSSFMALINMCLSNSQVRGINIYFANEKEAAEFGYKSTSKLHLHIGLKMPELMRSLAKNELCIANNSGGAHLASYLGVTSLGIYSGHSSPSEWAPQFYDGYVIHRSAKCSPCHGAKKSDCPNELFCLGDISPVDVYNLVVHALGKHEGESTGRREHAPRISLQKNTDTILSELIDALASMENLSDMDMMALSTAISKNHSTDYAARKTSGVMPDSLMHYNSSLIEWRGFNASEDGFRWTQGHGAEMRFLYPSQQSSSGTISLAFSTLGKQKIIASFNGKQVFDEIQEGNTIELKIPVTNLQEGINKLELTLPDARLPGNGDSRILALAVKSLRVSPTHA